MSDYRCLLRLLRAFLLLLCCFSCRIVSAQEISQKQWIYQQLQERISTARNEQTELRSYLQNAIDNVQLLEFQQQKLADSLAKLQSENAELTRSLKQCNDFSTNLQTENLKLSEELAQNAQEREILRKRRRVAVIVGVVASSVILAAGGVSFGILAAGR